MSRDSGFGMHELKKWHDQYKRGGRETLKSHPGVATDLELEQARQLIAKMALDLLAVGGMHHIFFFQDYKAFFRHSRAVSWLISSTICNSTSLSAKSFSVHRAAPEGVDCNTARPIWLPFRHTEWSGAKAAELLRDAALMAGRMALMDRPRGGPRGMKQPELIKRTILMLKDRPDVARVSRHGAEGIA